MICRELHDGAWYKVQGREDGTGMATLEFGDAHGGEIHIVLTEGQIKQLERDLEEERKLDRPSNRPRDCEWEPCQYSAHKEGKPCPACGPRGYYPVCPDCGTPLKETATHKTGYCQAHPEHGRFVTGEVK